MALYLGDNKKLKVNLNGVAYNCVIPKQPVAYFYNGVRLPKLPEWDTEVYSYAIILYVANLGTYLMLSSTPFYFSETVKNDTVTDAPSYVYYPKDKAWLNNAMTGAQIFETVDKYGMSTANGSLKLYWANHDVLNIDAQSEDERVYLEKSYPRALYVGDVLTTLYSGKLTTAISDDGTACMSGDAIISEGISSSETYKITVDGDSIVIKKTVIGSVTTYGNAYLYNIENDDTGGDWCIRTRPYNDAGVCRLYTREPGTYFVKIERLVTA